jgi:hypothetical protein
MVWLLGLCLLAVPASAEFGFDEKYERDSNLFNPINQYRPDNPLNPINRVDLGNHANPINRYNPNNPFNPINEYHPKNPLNPINRYNPNTPFARKLPEKVDRSKGEASGADVNSNNPLRKIHLQTP